MVKQRALTYLILVGALFGLTNCSEVVGSGELVSIPSVSFTCSSGTASNCGGAGTTNQFRVIYSTFDCTGAGDQSFYAKRSSTGYLTCNGTSCSGSTSGWIDEQGASTSLIPADNYTICVVAFRQGSITAGANAQDANGELAVVVTSSSPSFNITNFSNGAP